VIEEWDLASTNLHRVSARSYEVAVLPTAAVEPHNRHLPYGQDMLHATHVAREACRRAWAECPKVVCLPPLPFGVDCNLLDFPLAIHVSQRTLDTVIGDVAASLVKHGIRKLVLVNGHGGNSFAPLLRQLQHDLPIHVFLCNWWTVGSDHYQRIFEKPDDHAGEMETSVALALHPELVEAEHAGSGEAAPFRFEALRKGWVQTSRRFARLNDHCAVGDPKAATAEKGRRYLELVIGRIAAFLADLARSPIDRSFPHSPASGSP
jgi:creatinine amidohydrolase